jgi:glycosyltransferase involved in cell wall biosynthesis
MKRKTVFLDQGEFMGGAEHFLLDFLNELSPTEIRRLNPIVLGGECDLYQLRLPENIERQPFALPAVKGGKIAKIIALVKLVFTARRLKSELKLQAATQLFTNTPRAHLVALLLKKVWGWKGIWIVMVHDFTTKPESLLRRIGTQADVVIANSLPTRHWLKKALTNKDQSKLRLIENGVKLSAVNQPAPQLMTVLNLSRIDVQKGQMYFAEAADLLQDRNPDLTFCIVGDSVKEDPSTQVYETKVRAFVADRRVENLSFKPGVKQPLKTINEYDGLVFTPTEPETFGRVVIEALSLGKLVIAFDQTGPKEILEHYERWLLKNKDFQPKEPHWLLVEPNNAMSLAERIAYFADNPSEVKQYTQHAAEFVQQNYSLEETKKRLLAVLMP